MISETGETADVLVLVMRCTLQLVRLCERRLSGGSRPLGGALSDCPRQYRGVGGM